MRNNLSLNKSLFNPNDEFYTFYHDIEKELEHYKPFLKGKKIYCNCDDYRKSKFFEYFVDNFKKLGIKELVTSCYQNQNRTLFDSDTPLQKPFSCKVTYKNGTMFYDIKELTGDGHYASKECLELLRECDIVITNPPYSCLTDYIKTLISFNKQFLIIANHLFISIKPLFELVKNDKIKMGYNKILKFYTIQDGKEKTKIVTSYWLTNLPIQNTFRELKPNKVFDKDFYTFYEGLDIISVRSVFDIPKDYDGVMGVPFNFIEFYDKDRFELLGILKHRLINGKESFSQMLIKNKKPF